MNSKFINLMLLITLFQILQGTIICQNIYRPVENQIYLVDINVQRAVKYICVQGKPQNQIYYNVLSTVCIDRWLVNNQTISHIDHQQGKKYWIIAYSRSSVCKSNEATEEKLAILTQKNPNIQQKVKTPLVILIIIGFISALVCFNSLFKSSSYLNAQQDQIEIHSGLQQNNILQECKTFQQYKLLTNSEIFKILSTPIIISNLIFTFAPMIAFSVFPKFDLEAFVFFQKQSIFEYTIASDAAHFISLDYKWEHNYVFLPGLPYVLMLFKWIAQLFFIDYKNVMVILGLVFVKILNIFSAIFLYKIATKFNTSNSNYDLPYYTSCIFLFNPASSLFCFLTFLAIKNAFQNQEESQSLMSKPLAYISLNLSSILLFAASSIVRSMGIVYSSFFGIPLLIALFKSIANKKIVQSIKICITGIITAFAIASPFIIYLVLAYYRFCYNDPKSDFCYKTIPNIYAYQEQVTFNVKFLSQYYPLTQAVFIGYITICVCVIGIVYGYQMFTSYYKKSLIFIVSVQILVSIFFAHLAPSSRFFSTYPIFHLVIANFLKRQESINFSLIQKLLLFYLVGFNIFGVITYPLKMWIQ